MLLDLVVTLKGKTTMKFENRVAIVTGAARGIGRAIALAFISEGAKVSLVDMDAQRLDVAKNEITEREREWQSPPHVISPRVPTLERW